MIVELFAGPGGFSEGLRMAGHACPVVGLDTDMAACRTAAAAGHVRVRADVPSYPADRFAGVEGCVFGPPCPPFSRAGKGLGLLDQPALWEHVRQVALTGEWAGYPREGWHDPRSPLVLEVLRWVLATRCRWFVAEQVPAVLPFWRELARVFRAYGYLSEAFMVDAEEYGVPQTRDRAILCGSRDVAVRRPPATHQRYVPGEPARHGEPDLFGGDPVLPWVSMAEALGWGLPERPAWTVTGGGTATGGAEVFGNAAARRRLDAVAGIRSNYGAGGDPAARGFRSVTEPAATVTPKVGQKITLRETGEGRPRDADRPSSTIPGKGTADAVRVTVQEAGILQGFPPDYPWRGTKSQQYRQVGDAVPPPLAAAVFRMLGRLQ